jgi:hypothetical protein
MKKIKKELVDYNLRLPYQTWDWLKRISHEQKRSMRDIILDRVNIYKKKIEKKLTDEDSMV